MSVATVRTASLALARGLAAASVVTLALTALTLALTLTLTLTLNPGVANAQAPMNSAHGDIQPRSITEEEMQNYLGALEAMMKWADETDRKMEGASDPSQFMQSLSQEKQFQALVREHGFDQKSFIEVHTSVWQAFTNRAMKQAGPALQAMGQSSAMLEQYKAHMSPEDYAKAVAGIEQAKKQMAAAQAAVPPGNEALLDEYAPKLEAIIQSEGPSRR